MKNGWRGWELQALWWQKDQVEAEDEAFMGIGCRGSDNSDRTKVWESRWSPHPSIESDCYATTTRKYSRFMFARAQARIFSSAIWYCGGGDYGVHKCLFFFMHCIMLRVKLDGSIGTDFDDFFAWKARALMNVKQLKRSVCRHVSNYGLLPRHKFIVDQESWQNVCCECRGKSWHLMKTDNYVPAHLFTFHLIFPMTTWFRLFQRKPFAWKVCCLECAWES